MFDTPIHTGEQSIERVLKAGLPVLLVFWQEGCPPCQRLEPTLERLARLYAGRSLIAKINAADHPELARRYGITHIPGLVFVKGGQIEAQATGAASEESLRAWLDYLTQGGSRPALPSGPSVPLHQPEGYLGPHQGHREQQSGWKTWDESPFGHWEGPAAPPRGDGKEGPITLTDANFEQVIGGSPLPVLVDFWAAWCGPCRMIAPVIEQLAHELRGRAVIGKLNVDENPHTAQRLGVMSIPTLLLFKHGRVVDRIVGVQPVQVIRQRLLQHLR
ncbi:MAG: thioredoxin [Anaerolineae bacterium]|nr:thioredoxin [Anaerolineae bacterium]MDW8100951.1 thioredoxin [Anaerolineae bacterium]